MDLSEDHLENSYQIISDIVVPDADDAITEGAEVIVASPVLEPFRMLTAIDFNNQSLLTANEVDIPSVGRLLAGEFEAVELPIAKAFSTR